MRDERWWVLLVRSAPLFRWDGWMWLLLLLVGGLFLAGWDPGP